MKSTLLLIIVSLLVPIATDCQAAQQKSAEDNKEAIKLKKKINEDQAVLAKLKLQLDDPKKKFNKADKALQEIENKLKAKTTAHQKFLDQMKSAEAKKIKIEIDDLENLKKLTEKLYALALQERAMLQKTAKQLEESIAQNEKALNQLLMGTTNPEKGPENPKGKKDPPNQKPPIIDPGKKTEPTPPPKDKPKAIDPELRKALEEAKVKKVEAQQALDKAKSLADRLSALRQFIVGDKKLLRLQQKKSDNAKQLLADFEQQLQKKLADKNAKDDEITTLKKRISDLQQLVQTADTETKTTSDRIQRNQMEMMTLQTDLIQLYKRVDEKRKAAESAQKKVDELRNPFTPRNIAQWAINHGPSLLIILIVMFVLHRVSKVFSYRIIRLMMRKRKREDEKERAYRADTLSAVLHNAASIAIVIGGLIMILDEAGVPIGPLLGGAAILGLAIAFGAQNLFKDYFTGFMILMEDQYGINDIIKIGDVRGTVERITLRMTVIRDIAGVAHFFPHGTLNTISNYTYGWSRAVFEVGVAYKENVDRVIEVLVQLANELREDPEFGPKILDKPRMLGVDDFGESAVVIKFHLKTVPSQQWKVRWELNRRIKNKFDEIGIEIPFPHRTVFHRQADTPLKILSAKVQQTEANSNGEEASKPTGSPEPA